MTLLARLKGWIGEKLTSAASRLTLDPSIYTQLNDLTLNTPNGTTQIDHVIVSRHGVFVVEAKNIDGWIFGDASSPQWTVARFGRKHRMQNPLHQNHRHVRAVVACLGIDPSRVHSLVMFWGECEFKTPMPPNVLNTGYSSYIKRFTDVVFTDAEVARLVATLQGSALPRTRATRQAHLASLERRHGSTTTCPKCGSALVRRTARSGPKAGQAFLGCSAFPKCRHTRPVERTG